MPIFERQYQVATQGPKGNRIPVPPAIALQQIGPVLSVTISPTKQHLDALVAKNEVIPASIAGLAIIDTGASVTAVDEAVCQKLGIEPTGQMKTSHAGGSEIRACYPIQIIFPGSPFPPFVNPRAMSVNLQFGKTPYLLLFGRDLLAQLKFVYNGPLGRIEIAF